MDLHGLLSDKGMVKHSMRNGDSNNRLRGLIAQPANCDHVAIEPHVFDLEWHRRLGSWGSLKLCSRAEGGTEKGLRTSSSAVDQSVDTLGVIGVVRGKSQIREAVAVRGYE